MNKRLLAMTLVLMALAGQAAALDTNTWNFSTNADYYISPSDQPLITIDTTQSVARLILLSDRLSHSTFAEYVTNGSSHVSTRLGPDVSVSLTQAGGTYQSSGMFVSRVLDSGSPANTWQKLYARATYGTIDNSPGEIKTGAGGPVALYHMENNWMDSVTLASGTPVGAPGFSANAKFGAYAGNFNGANYVGTANATLLNGKTEAAISFWMKLSSLKDYGGLVTSRSGPTLVDNGIQQWPGGTIMFIINNTTLVQSPRLDSNRWYFVVGVWSAVSGKARLYLDGAQVGEASTAIASITQTGVFRLANDAYNSNWNSSGLIDEVAIYDRALSEEEIQDLYARAMSFYFQLRGGNSVAAITNSSNLFTGPDGTTNTYYFGEYKILQTAGSFDVTNRYAQYKTYLVKDASGNTPWVDAVALFGDLGLDYDYSSVDFQLGSYLSNVTNYPEVADTPYIAMAKKENGGYYTNGMFASRIMDAGNSVTWRRLEWETPGELTNSMSGMMAVYHLNGSWGDSANVVGGDNAPTAITLSGNAWTAMPKLGGGCCRFDGVSSHVTGFPGMASNIMAMEFWISDDNAQDGIMTFGSYSGGSAYLAISNGVVVTRNFPGNQPQVFVNGIAGSRKLMAGWNHVALIMDNVLGGVSLDVGVANGDYMQGLLDEMAIYTRQVSSAEMKAHYLLGRQNVAGRVRFNVRAADSIAALTGGVWSVDLNASPADINIPGQYFQYRLVMDGDGSAAPAVKSIVVGYLNPGWQYMYDNNRDAIYRGTFVNDTTRWCGDEVMLTDQSQWGPANLMAGSEIGLASEWRLDDAVWGTVVDTVGGKNGVAAGGALPTASAKVGLRSGVFNGVDQYLSLGAPTVGSGDFTVGAWAKSTSTNRSAVVSTFAGGPHYTLEFNSDGVSNSPGRTAFVVDDGTSGRKVASSVLSDLNDNRWHHIAGSRSGGTVNLFVDGDRVASTSLGSGYGSVGSGTPYVAKYGTSNLFFKGQIDEVVVYQRALSDSELGELSGTAYRTRDRGIYTSEVIDVGRQAIWQSMSWSADAPYNKPLSTMIEANLVALWHFDSNTLDSAGMHDGVTAGGAGFSNAGRFSSCLSLSGAGQWIGNITDDAELRNTNMTVEAWVYPSAVDSRVVFDKRSGALGYQLGTDASGRPYFVIGAAANTCKDPSLSLRTGQWSHLAATYSGNELILYVDGELRAKLVGTGAMGTSDARIGADGAGANCFSGLIDEVAVHNRVLDPSEVLDHYRSGAVTLKFQARAASNSTLITSVPFRGPDATTNTFYTVSSGESLLTSVPIGQCFQYRAYLATENHRFTPRLQGVRIDGSSYSTNNPAVENAVSVFFPGKITMFSHKLATNDDSTVRYQISGDDGVTWYFWPAFTNAWVNEALYGGGWDCASPVGTVNANIGSFYRQLYEKVGVNAKWRAFLHSQGSDQVAVDSVAIGYSQGRIVVTVPNGTETNKNAWLIGTTNIVQWSHLGTVPGRVTIQYSNENSGGVWVNIATGITATAGSCPWLTPSVVASHTLVRILHETDPTIWDVSDGEFELVQRYRVVYPNGGETLYIGETNILVWGAANGLASVNLDFSGDDTWTNPVSIGKSISSKGGSMSNTYTWTALVTNPALPSETARIRVQTPGGGFTDYSDNYFIHAGASITAPEGGSKVKQSSDDPYTLTWKSAGCGGAVKIELQTQTNGPWLMVSSNAPNVSGWNTFDWMATNNPTEEAKLRITSLTDPRAKGESAGFIIAAIEVKSPRGDPDPAAAERWLMMSTQTVAWLSAGASASVNIYYSTDGGSNWMPIVSGYPNNNTAGFTNTFQWVVSNTPSAKARIKVEDFDRPFDLWSRSKYNFHIAGLRVIYPNGPLSQEWLKGVSGIVTWEDNAVGNGCTVEMSYSGGSNWVTVSGPGQSLIDKAAPPFTPAIPTVRGLVRITADDATPFTNVFDQSDNYFAVAGVLIEAPTSSVSYTIGTTNSITYVAAATHAPGFLSDIYYSSDGVTFDKTWPIKSPEIFSETYPGRHGFDWIVEPMRKPSKTARIMVTAGTYTNISDLFTLRGMRIRQPAAGAIWARGDLRDIQWDVAGVALSSEGDVYVSTEGNAPASFTNKVNGPRVVINDGGTAWSIPTTTEPTTNAYAKVIITYAPDQPADVGLEAYSQIFTVRGLKLMSPTNGAVFQLGGTCTIQWKAADAGASVNLYYSPDGGTNYEVIALAQASGDGIRSYVWNVEMSRRPSSNARVKVVSATGLQDVSQPFVLQGIKITEPRNQFVFARTSPTNMIRWVAVGDAGPYALSWTTNGSTFTPIQTVAAVSEYNWDTIPAEAVSPGVVIRIVGAGFSNTSDVFTIVSQPAIFLTSPVADDFWGVGASHNIQWRRAGNMTMDFSVLFSLKPYSVTNDITDTPNITYDDNNKTYTMPWTVPDQPTQARIIVRHNTDPTIGDVSGIFNLCGRFQVLYPNGGEELFALQPTPVVWRTIGSVPFVDIYYSETPPYWANSWIKMNTAPVTNKFNATLTPEQTTWSWEVAKTRTTLGRFRVQEAQYTNTFDATELMAAGKEQPGDESDSAFAVSYYTVYWDVRDALTTQRLDRLAVIDSSGWSASSQSCILPNTISRDYPWGTWNTVWYREFYFDQSIVDWTSENTALGGPRVWTQQVLLARSTIEPEYHAMASFSYQSSNKVFTIHAWLERGGTILDTPTSCRVTVYDATGATVGSVDSATVPGSLQSTGVFWMTWDASAFPKGTVLFAKVDIQFSSYWYSSGVTFTLNVPVGDEIQGMVAGISNQVTGVSNQISDHESAQAMFRADVRSNLAEIVSTMGALPGLTNLASAVSNLNDAVSGVAKITNLNEIATALNDIRTLVSSNLEIAVSSAPRITFRATTIKSGSTNIITYMTRMGLGSGPQMTVQNASGAVTYQNNMTEVAGAGMYKGEVTFASGWGLGEFTITCNDSAAAGAPGDQITVQVVDETYWTDKTTLSSVTGRLAAVEGIASNIWRVVGATDFGGGFSNMLAAVSNVETMVRNSGLTNGAIQSLMLDVSNVFVSVSNLQQIVNNVSASNSIALGVLGSGVSNVLVSVTNVQQVVSSASASNSAALGALRSDVSNVLVSVTNVQQTVNSTSLSNSLALAALRTDISSILGSVTNLSSLTNLFQLNSLTSLAVLTNLTSLTSVDFAAIQAGVADVRTRVADIDWNAVTQTAAELAALRASTEGSFQALEAQLSGLSGIAGAVDALGAKVLTIGTSSADAARNSRTAKTQVTAVQGLVSSLRLALGQGDKDTAMTMLGGIRDQLAAIRGMVGTKVSMQPVLDLMVPMAADINTLARRKNLDDLVTIPAEMRNQTQVTEKSLVQVNNKIAEINAAIEFLNKLVDKVANPPEVMIYYTTD